MSNRDDVIQWQVLDKRDECKRTTETRTVARKLKSDLEKKHPANGPYSIAKLVRSK